MLRAAPERAATAAHDPGSADGGRAPIDDGHGTGLEDAAELRQAAERVQASGILGEARLKRLFDYLVSRSVAGQSPKEITIAIDVFGKDATFDVAQDALVRVYIHKLRKTLEEFYAAREHEGSSALHIPRGEYRLRLLARVPTAPGRARPRLSPGVTFVSAAAALCAAFLLGLGIAWWRPHTSDLDGVRANTTWSAILQDDRPIIIAVSDYYLIGEVENGGMEVKRLVREFGVNSKGDLNDYIAEHPEYASRYMDVGLRYLPPATAFALRDVMAVLAPANRRVSVTPVSALQPASLKSADIVYIGYLSGLGVMQDLFFTGSRFALGESDDEVIDRKTRHSYVSETFDQIMGPPQPAGAQAAYHDYGIVARFRGPGGNHILVISGTRDAGVRQSAEALTTSEKLEELGRQVDSTQPVEALLEVRAVDGVNLADRLLLASRRDAGNAN